MGELASGLLDDILERVDVSLDRARALLRAAAPAEDASGSGAAAAPQNEAAPVAGVLSTLSTRLPGPCSADAVSHLLVPLDAL